MCVENVGAPIQKIKFRDIFLSILCQKKVNLVPNSYFCCNFCLIRGTCSLKTWKNWNIYLSTKKANLTFKLDNFWLSKIFRLNGEKQADVKKHFLSTWYDLKQNKIILSPLPFPFCIIRCYQVIKKLKWF